MRGGDLIIARGRPRLRNLRLTQAAVCGIFHGILKQDWSEICRTPLWQSSGRSGMAVKSLVAVSSKQRPDQVDWVWNVMAHAQKPDLVFRGNGRVHLNRRGRQFSRRLTAEVCASAVVMLDTPCSEVISSSLLHPCVTVCHHISTGLYHGLAQSSHYTP